MIPVTDTVEQLAKQLPPSQCDQLKMADAASEMDEMEIYPQPGDLIEIFSPMCQHWLMYAGNGEVVHLVPEETGAGSSLPTQAVVKMEPLAIVEGRKYRINNKYDKRHKPLPVDEIISKAKAAVGKTVYYSLLIHNCEHFVTKLRYGIFVSDQVTKGLKIAAYVAIVSSPPLLITGAVIFVPVIAAASLTSSLLHRCWRKKQQENE